MASPSGPGPLERRLVGSFVRATLFRRRHSKPRAVPPHLQHEELRFIGNSGAKLVGRFFSQPAPAGVVVLAHPDRRYAQHWFVKTGWIDWLLANGYSVLTFDFTNYGGSHGGSTYLFEDLIAASHLAREKQPGTPVHVIGLSLGAFSAANAGPELDFVESMVLESPYPSFNSWYEGDGHRIGKGAMKLFDKLWPRTARLIQADQRIGQAHAKRILVAASRSDEVTGSELSRRVFLGAKPGMATWFEVDGVEHLGLFEASQAYREAVLATLRGTTEPLALKLPELH